MERVVVQSGAVASVGYDPATETLEVCFPSGAVWQYFDFPPEKYAEFMAADSLGRWFAMFVRANYKSQRLHDGECAKYLDCHVVNCRCWCHVMKGRQDAEIPNPDYTDALKKSVKHAKKKRQA